MIEPEPEIVALTYPRLIVGVSVNGHMTFFVLEPDAFTEMVEDEEIDPFNFIEVWVYLSKNIHRYLMSVVSEIGPVDDESVKLLNLKMDIYQQPEVAQEVLTCEDCLEGLIEDIEGDDDD